MDEGKGGVTGSVPATEVDGEAQAPVPPSPDPICEDCESPLSEHTGAGASHPWNACRRFIPIGPKS